MNHKEKTLLEAVQNMLRDKTELGLSFHGDRKETSHMAQYRHEDIENMFRIKVNKPEVNMYEAICAAFYHTHSYRNIDDPSFPLAFEKQMGRIVPPSDRRIALSVVADIIKELDNSKNGFDIEDRNTIGKLDDLRAATKVNET